MAGQGARAGAESAGKKAFTTTITTVRGAQGGIYMFGMLGTFLPTAAGVLLASNPVLLGIGAVFGGMGLADDRKRKIAARRQAARSQVRQFLDDVQFEMGNQIGNLIREIQRDLRDEFSDRIGELRAHLHRDRAAGAGRRAEVGAGTSDSAAPNSTRRWPRSPRSTRRSRRWRCERARELRCRRCARRRPRPGRRCTQPGGARTGAGGGRSAQRSAARGHRRSREGRQVHAAERAGRRAAGADRCRRVHAHRQLATAAAPATRWSAMLRDGRTEPLAFTRAGGALDIKLGALDEKRHRDHRRVVAHLVAGDRHAHRHAGSGEHQRRELAPHPRLPGGRPRPAQRCRRRHLPHAPRAPRDIAFLDAFMDRTVTAASPVNAVAVLSRADEIGAGRLDAMESSARIAARYEHDPQLRGLCAAVVPMAGLLAETGLTLREDEVAALRMLANTDDATLERMLLSADQFCDTRAAS